MQKDASRSRKTAKKSDLKNSNLVKSTSLFDKTSPKLAELVAHQIEIEIVRQGWVVGERLGSEIELAQKFGTSRWIVREALSITERDGLISINRGRFGGITIASPAVDAVGSSIKNYLGICDVSPQDLVEARKLIEDLVIKFACEHLTNDSINTLRSLACEFKTVSNRNSIELSQRIWGAILSASKSPALILFDYSLSQLTADITLRFGVTQERLGSDTLKDTLPHRLKMIEAIIANDVGLACEYNRKILDQTLKFMTASHPTTTDPQGLADFVKLPRLLLDKPDKIATPPPPRRLSEQITEHLQNEILVNRWPVGHHVGTENDLLERYGVSRSVLREAIRPLERFGVVEMHRGKQNGFKVAKPRPRAIIRTAALYLGHESQDVKYLSTIEKTLQVEAAKKLATKEVKIRQKAVASMRAIFDEDIDFTVGQLQRQVNTFFNIMANEYGNDSLALFMQILVQVMAIEFLAFDENNLPNDMVRTYQHQYQILIDAIEAGDAAIAARRMIQLHDLLIGTGASIKLIDQLIQ